MSEILITGFEMPPKDDTYGLHLVIYPNGDVWIAYDDKPTGKAIEVPPHGVLKDIDVLNDAIIEAVRLGEITGGEAAFFKAILNNAPRVIDASKH